MQRGKNFSTTYAKRFAYTYTYIGANIVLSNDLQK